jgi:ATP-dependent helicase IRC3
MPLREYQREVFVNSLNRFEAGVKRQLIVMPTGTGKGNVIAYIPKVYKKLLGPGKKVLVLVHRKELVEDLAARLARYNPQLNVQVERAEERATQFADIIVASIPSIGRLKSAPEEEDKQSSLFDPEVFDFSDELADQWNDRIKRFNPADFPIIIIDEAHHIHGETYANVCRYFDVFKNDPRYNNPEKLLIGFTATPKRADNKGLDLYFDEIVSQRDLLWYIQNNYLADVESYRINTTIELDSVKTTAGDFNIAQLEKTVNTPERNDLIVRKYLEHGAGLPALAFCVDIQHGVDLAAKFQERGIQAVALNYKTPEDERERIIAEFKAGKIPVLCSATLLTEGFDATIATVALMGRPTKSETLYRQMFGRVLRPHPSPEEVAYRQAQQLEIGYVKKAAIVLDFVDVSTRHNLTSVPSLFGLNPKFDTRGKRMTEVVAEVARLQAKQPKLDLSDAKSMFDLQAISERIDLFAKQSTPTEVRAFSNMAWLAAPGGGFELSLPDFKSYIVAKNTAGVWQVFRSIKGIRSPLQMGRNLGETFKIAESYMTPAEKLVGAMNSEWRTGEISDAQLKLFGQLYPDERRAFKDFDAFREFMRSKYTKGDVSTLISQRIKRRSPKVMNAIKRRTDAKKRSSR